MRMRILNIIPKAFRAKGLVVSLTIFVRAMLKFVGLAALHEQNSFLLLKYLHSGIS